MSTPTSPAPSPFLPTFTSTSIPSSYSIPDSDATSDEEDGREAVDIFIGTSVGTMIALEGGVGDLGMNRDGDGHREIELREETEEKEEKEVIEESPPKRRRTSSSHVKRWVEALPSHTRRVEARDRDNFIDVSGWGSDVEVEMSVKGEMAMTGGMDIGVEGEMRVEEGMGMREMEIAIDVVSGSQQPEADPDHTVPNQPGPKLSPKKPSTKNNMKIKKRKIVEKSKGKVKAKGKGIEKGNAKVKVQVNEKEKEINLDNIEFTLPLIAIDHHSRIEHPLVPAPAITWELEVDIVIPGFLMRDLRDEDSEEREDGDGDGAVSSIVQHPEQLPVKAQTANPNQSSENIPRSYPLSCYRTPAPYEERPENIFEEIIRCIEMRLNEVEELKDQQGWRMWDWREMVTRGPWKVWVGWFWVVWDVDGEGMGDIYGRGVDDGDRDEESDEDVMDGVPMIYREGVERRWLSLRGAGDGGADGADQNALGPAQVSYPDTNTSASAPPPNESETQPPPAELHVPIFAHLTKIQAGNPEDGTTAGLGEEGMRELVQILRERKKRGRRDGVFVEFFRI